jgi:hypothetical protein
METMISKKRYYVVFKGTNLMGRFETIDSANKYKTHYESEQNREHQ